MITRDIFDFFRMVFYAFLVASVAQKRGYPFGLWMLLSVGIQPLMLLFVLATLPDRTLDRRRAREASILDKQLAQAVHGAPTLHVVMPGRSLGDASTFR